METGDFSEVPAATLDAAASSIVVTTAPDIPYAPTAEVIDIISAEVAVGMNFFKDLAIAWKDGYGGRSGTLQNELRDARQACLRELRREALLLGANAVVAVDLDYSEFQGAVAGSNMFFVVATGTAVKLA
ncbi:UPF0145 protein [Hansschlegelia plantiphila]|uniref:UPF0145 protein n=1 Tax=Hansschlegelia plantiphila TaxID=374655 RepID=A0A9W6IXJ3_9HYPH|nr:UPF0145 protein [Hansschlegelia plantiphila]